MLSTILVIIAKTLAVTIGILFFVALAWAGLSRCMRCGGWCDGDCPRKDSWLDNW